jgi:TfoX/Sxy family transcriptional regulator of competence genes
MTPDEISAAVRAALAGTRSLREVKMFGGIGFMLNGNMVAAASRRGLLLRVGKERQHEVLARPGARPMEMRGRVMEGYVYVDPPALTDGGIEAWLRPALAFVQTLPPKTSGAKTARRKGKKQ